MSIPDENSQKLLIIIFKSKKALICILNFSKASASQKFLIKQCNPTKPLTIKPNNPYFYKQPYSHHKAK